MSARREADMTLDEARQLLDAVRAGTSNPPAYRIRKALQLTGDLRSTWERPLHKTVDKHPVRQA